MGSVVTCRTVGNGTEGGSRDQNPTTILMLDRVQFETGGVRKESLDMARGRSHLFLIIKHCFASRFGRVDSSLLLPSAAGCLMKNVTRSKEGNEWQIEEATEHDNEAGTD